MLGWANSETTKTHECCCYKMDRSDSYLLTRPSATPTPPLCRSGIPSSGDTVCFTGTGALLWNMGDDAQQKAELSLPSETSRGLRPGDRVGIVVDIAIGTAPLAFRSVSLS